MKRLWYWPVWKLSYPWQVKVWTGGDEYGRTTKCLSLGPLGTFIFALEPKSWREWIERLVQADLEFQAIVEDIRTGKAKGQTAEEVIAELRLAPRRTTEQKDA